MFERESRGLVFIMFRHLEDLLDKSWSLCWTRNENFNNSLKTIFSIRGARVHRCCVDNRLELRDGLRVQRKSLKRKQMFVNCANFDSFML